MNIFAPDSKLLQFLSRVADLLILNLLFILTSLPVVTVGASVTALYCVCFRLGTREEGRLVADYFRSFRTNFKQATVIWLIVLLLLVISAVDLYAASAMGGVIRCFSPLFWILLIITGFLHSFAFPTLSQFDNTVGMTIKNALLMCIAHIPTAAVLTALNFLPVILLALNIMLFLKLCVLFVTLYFSTLAYYAGKKLQTIYNFILDPEGKKTRQEEEPEGM